MLSFRSESLDNFMKKLSNNLVGLEWVEFFIRDFRTLFSPHYLGGLIDDNVLDVGCLEDDVLEDVVARRHRVRRRTVLGAIAAH